MRHTILTAVLLSLFGAPLALGQAPPNQADPVLAFVGARLHPVSGPEIPDGVLVVRDGLIAAVGIRGEVEIPPDARSIDSTGHVILPGLVCTHSHVGEPWGADSSDPVQPEVRSFDGIDVRAASVHRARAGGLTTINAMPGSGHLISGQTSYLKLRLGGTIEELCYRFPDGAPMGGLKMANGTNPQGEKPFPGTRAKSAALVRAKYLAANEYRAKLARADEDPDVDPPARDLSLEPLVEVLDGKRIVHFHTHRHDDILTVLRLAEEFGFRVVLHHVSEGWKVADEIAAAGAPCSVILVDSPGGKLEARDLSFDTPARLVAAGVPVSIHTDDYITDSRLFLRSAALAVRAGLDRDAALAALTLRGAEQLDLADRIGSLEVGKDADLCVLDGDPLALETQVLETWVEGERVFDLADPDDRLYAVGGRGAGDERSFTGCCANVRGGAR
jgi:imidazolonepropionase-like amidohydrolase